MNKISEFYNYLSKITQFNDLYLNNISQYFSYQKTIKITENSNGFINEIEPYKSFKVIHEKEIVESIILYPKKDELIISLWNFKEQIGKEYSIYHNYRDNLTEFVFIINPHQEIRFLIYIEITIKKNILVHNNKPILENNIICDELEIRFKK